MSPQSGAWSPEKFDRGLQGVAEGEATAEHGAVDRVHEAALALCSALRHAGRQSPHEVDVASRCGRGRFGSKPLQDHGACVSFCRKCLSDLVEVVLRFHDAAQDRGRLPDEEARLRRLAFEELVVGGDKAEVLAAPSEKLERVGFTPRHFADGTHICDAQPHEGVSCVVRAEPAPWERVHLFKKRVDWFVFQ